MRFEGTHDPDERFPATVILPTSFLGPLRDPLREISLIARIVTIVIARHAAHFILVGAWARIITVLKSVPTAPHRIVTMVAQWAQSEIYYRLFFRTRTMKN